MNTENIHYICFITKKSILTPKNKKKYLLCALDNKVHIEFNKTYNTKFICKQYYVCAL